MIFRVDFEQAQINLLILCLFYSNSNIDDVLHVLEFAVIRM